MKPKKANMVTFFSWLFYVFFIFSYAISSCLFLGVLVFLCCLLIYDVYMLYKCFLYFHRCQTSFLGALHIGGCILFWTFCEGLVILTFIYFGRCFFSLGVYTLATLDCTCVAVSCMLALCGWPTSLYLLRSCILYYRSICISCSIQAGTVHIYLAIVLRLVPFLYDICDLFVNIGLSTFLGLLL